jgi:uncharacterized protein
LIKQMVSGSVRLQCDKMLPHHDLGPRGRAPRVALVADLDGRELNGMFVLSRLAAFLRGIEAGERRGLRLRERVVIVPTVSVENGQGAGTRPIVRARVASQRRSGERSMTRAVMELTQAAYYRVDIHPVSLDIEELPHLSLYAPNDDERASACLFGLPAVIERPAEDESTPDLVRAWRRSCGGENFVIHGGQAGGLQTGHCETLFRALVAFLDRTGIIGGLRLVGEEEQLRYFGSRQVAVVRAGQSGIFASSLEVGRWVQFGEELGRIHDGFTGRVRARVTVPVSGLLVSLRRQPLLGKQDLVARILAPDAASER